METTADPQASLSPCLSPTSELHKLWADSSSRVRLTSPALQSWPALFSFSSTAASHSNSLGKMKSLGGAKPHPYIPRSSAQSQCGSYYSLKSARSIYRTGSSGCSGLTKQTEPGNMFFEGFKDCASEVLRFLREVECVEDSNPLAQGLQSHLAEVCRTICPESMADPHTGLSSAQSLAEGMSRNQEVVSRVPELHLDNVMCLCPPSPTQAPLRINRHTVCSSECSASRGGDTNHAATASSSSLTSTYSPASLSSLSGAAINMDTAYLQASKLSMSATDRSRTSMLQMNATLPASHLKIASLDQFSPILQPRGSSVDSKLSTQTTPSISPTGDSLLQYDQRLPKYSIPEEEKGHTRCTTASAKISDAAVKKATLNFSSSSETMPENLSTSSTSNLPDSDPVIAWCLQPPAFSASSLSIQGSQPISLHPINNSFVPTCPSDPQLQCDTGVVHSDNSSGDRMQQVGSVLELRPNLLPGVTSSSVASGNFADVLLAVESCRGHNDSRVRALADELIYLIHNDGEDDFDEDEDIDNREDFNSDEGDEEGGGGDESGIEMDDSIGNPADLIEQ
ncbi:hypothetical protein RRG08_017210 [Elysia crispata]|uniref:Orange domain-containing protein n=1 Tax=Elysia crispata TaxID=231223 RepID=A0AAE1DN27_9GAST|nr:hypothetical protein RRG08_017210 [Elysia crispata]